MGNGLSIAYVCPQVEGGDDLVAEDDLEEAIGFGWAQGDDFALKGFRKPERAAGEADAAALADAAEPIVVRIRKGSGDLAKGARAGGVAIGRNGQADALVRTLAVVDVAPALEGAGGGEAGEGRPGQDLGL